MSVVLPFLSPRSYDRDFEYDYFGFKTLEKSYLLRMKGKVVERPQQVTGLPTRSQRETRGGAARDGHVVHACGRSRRPPSSTIAHPPALPALRAPRPWSAARTHARFCAGVPPSPGGSTVRACAGRC